jgi:hypothetical protein
MARKLSCPPSLAPNLASYGETDFASGALA